MTGGFPPFDAALTRFRHGYHGALTRYSDPVDGATTRYSAAFDGGTTWFWNLLDGGMTRAVLRSIRFLALYTDCCHRPAFFLRPRDGGAAADTTPMFPQSWPRA